ncbi:MAG: hypothetical protein V4525_14015 [Pseudomonadota bacterium]
MNEENKFFSNKNNVKAIKKFIDHLDSIDRGNDFEIERNKKIISILKSIIEEPKKWNDECETTINTNGREFIEAIADNNSHTQTNIIDDIFVTILRFIVERKIKTSNRIPDDLYGFEKFAIDNVEKFSDFSDQRIKWVHISVSNNIVSHIINHPNIESVKKFNQSIDSIDKVIGEFSVGITEKINVYGNELEEKIKTVEKIKENLEQYKTGFNFVGLSKGFDELIEKKEKELKTVSWVLYVFGLIAVIPILLEIYFLFNKFDNGKDISHQIPIISIIPTISLIVIFVYYFRIILSNYKSLKAQILQLELRNTLCRFIQNYADYASSIKEKDKDALNKFENIIFSGLITDEDKLPSTFDGIDQFTNMIKAIKSS